VTGVERAKGMGRRQLDNAPQDNPELSHSLLKIARLSVQEAHGPISSPDIS
jgi:hypothetical protein